MRNHTAWLKDLIEEIPSLATKTFVTIAKYPAPNEATKVLPPYVVLHPSDGIDRQTRVTGPRVGLNPRWTIHGVGLTADQAGWVGEAVKKKLVPAGRGVVPTITGERAQRMWWSSPLPIQLDKDVDPPLCLHIAECGFTSELL